jgi:hypothetical protein
MRGSLRSSTASGSSVRTTRSSPFPLPPSIWGSCPRR